MKKLLLLFVLLLVSGCASLVPTVEEVNKLEIDIAALNASIDRRQEEVKNKFTDVQNTVAKVNEAIQVSSSVLEAAQNVNEVTAPINPYSGVISGILGLVSALTVGTGAVAVKKTRESNKKQNDLAAIVAKVNRLAAEANPEEGKKISEALNGK